MSQHYRRADFLLQGYLDFFYRTYHGAFIIFSTTYKILVQFYVCNSSYFLASPFSRKKTSCHGSCTTLPSLLLAADAFASIFDHCSTYSNISLGSSLTALNNNNSSWESPSGEFAFGFQQVGEGGFLLAIWFNKIPRTDGRFVLNDPKNDQIWSASADSAITGVAYAAMLDTGNFVLASRDSINLWESFDQPTDTILPTQTLEQESKLVARFPEMNYSSRSFQFTLQGDGNLVLYTTAFPMESVNFAYWSSDTVGSGFQLIFNQSSYIYLTARNGSILNQIWSDEALTRDFYQRAIIEYDGVFRKYVYPKNAGSSTRRWPMAWSTVSGSIPSNICTRITADTGSGACGFNSYCRLGDDQRPNCEFPPDYILLDPKNKMSGCKQNFVSQSCDKASQEMHLFHFREMLASY